MVGSFNYEDIYEILRNEKFSSDLQELTKSDLKRIKDYFEEKSESTKNKDQSTNIFASHNRAKVQLELDNAGRVVKDLLEKRERKIISRAVFNNRIENSLRDASNMLQIEEELYDQLLFILKRFRKGFLSTIDNEGEYPMNILQPLKLRDDLDVKKLLDTVSEEPEKVEESVTVQNSEVEASEEYVSIANIPEFYGPDANKYGPFKVGETVICPFEIIELLLKQNKIKSSKLSKDDESIVVEDNIEFIPIAEQETTNEDVNINSSSFEEFKNEALSETIDTENEISETNKDILSGKTVQKAHNAQNKTAEEQS